MQRSVGNPRFPIWLLADSNPRQWQSVLQTPLDLHEQTTAWESDSP